MEGSTWQSWKDPRFTLRANVMLSPYCCVAWELKVPCVFLLWTRCSSEARHCFSKVFCPLRFLEVGQMLQEYTDQSLRKAPTQPWRSPETAACSCSFRITSVFEAMSHFTWTSSAKVRTNNGSWKGIFLPTRFLASGWGKWWWEGQAISTFSPTSGQSPQWDNF